MPPLQVEPDSVFVLPPAAVQELQLKVQPWRAGSRFLYVNAVDVEHRRLVTTWLLCLNVHRPVLSKVQVLCLLSEKQHCFVLLLSAPICVVLEICTSQIIIRTVIQIFQGGIKMHQNLPEQQALKVTSAKVQPFQG